jgi:hypothetical protein
MVGEYLNDKVFEYTSYFSALLVFGSELMECKKHHRIVLVGMFDRKCYKDPFTFLFKVQSYLYYRASDQISLSIVHRTSF